MLINCLPAINPCPCGMRWDEVSGEKRLQPKCSVPCSSIHVVGHENMRTPALVCRQWLFKKPEPTSKAKVLEMYVKHIVVIKMDIIFLVDATDISSLSGPVEGL